MTALVFGSESEIDSANAENERMPVARDQLSTAMLDDGECSEAVELQFENPFRMIERSGPLQERHRLEISVRFSGVPRSIPQLLRERALKVGWDEPAHFPLALSWTLLRCQLVSN